MLDGSIGNWAMMFHANAFITDIQPDQLKGRDKLFSTNWFMTEGQRQFGRHHVTVRTMLSRCFEKRSSQVKTGHAAHL
jgi:hypothetical protein